MSEEQRSFQWPDYLVFFLMLAVSLAIGIYHAFSGGKQKTTSEFLMGNRGLKVFPVAVSILVSLLSANLILGAPAEVYLRGGQFVIFAIGRSLGALVAVILFVPLLYPLRLTSSYEYLEKRFESRAAKLTGSFILAVKQILYMGITLYAPSTALEAVTQFPTWAAIIISGTVSTVYTGLGGMKAVVWTDVFQSFIMVGGLLAILIKGTADVGGIGRVWEISRQAGRTELFDFDPDPTKRHTFWGLTIGAMVAWTSRYGVNQASVQRYSALPTQGKARAAVLLNIPGLFFMLIVTCLSGLVMFAYYKQKGCDPLAAGRIRNPNQLLPYFVMEVLNVPGLPGLFFACLFSGALSTASSSLNALAAVVWQDILSRKLDHLSELKKVMVTKSLVIFFGAVGIGSAFLAQALGGTVIQVAVTFTGGAGGPLLGLFFLGAVLPCSEWLGVVIGGVTGLAFALWIGFGAYATGIYHPVLNTTIENCPANWTIPTPTPPGKTVDQLVGIERLYSISYLWYPSIGFATVVVIGMLISCFKGFTNPRDVEGKYFLPIIERLCCCLPKSTLEVARCGVPEEEDLSTDENNIQIKNVTNSKDEHIAMETVGKFRTLSPDSPPGLVNQGYEDKQTT